MRTGIYGWRARIGYAGLSPLCTTPYEFWTMAPDGVAMVCTGLRIDSDPGDDYAASYADVTTAAGALDKFELDVVALGVVPHYWSRLPSLSPFLRERLSAATRSPLLFPDDMIAEVLAGLGARSVALVSPFSSSENEGIRQFLTASGHEVTTIVSVAQDHNQPGFDGVHELGVRAAREKPADVIYVAGERWPVAPHVARLEAEFGVTVIGDTIVLLATALRRLRIRQRVEGFGKLLQSI